MKINIFPIILILVVQLSFAQDKKYVESELKIPTETETITGTLLKAENSPHLVIIIPGSGPTDRNGNQARFQNNSLKYLAESLSSHNVSTFRYDKSVLSINPADTVKIKTLTFDTFIDEAASVIAHFRSENEFKHIIVAGHSQGSLVGMVACQSNADGFISIAGAGRPMGDLLIEQIGKNAPMLKEETQRIISELKKGNLVDDFNPMLVSVFNKDVQPFLMSYLKYSPTDEIKNLEIPVLIINGTKDVQIPASDAELLHEANSTSEILIIEDMNHVLKEIKGDVSENMASYQNPELPVMEELTSKILTFVKSIN